jgi:molybdopterin converting factor small subunit
MAETPGAITVRLFAGLEARTLERRAVHEFTGVEAFTVGAVVARLGLPPGVAGLVLVNGLHARDDQELMAGDEVSLFPPLGGG